MQELKFGTETPIEYVEKALGITIGIKAFGNITFNEEVGDDKKERILSPFVKALSLKIKEYGDNGCSYADLPAMRLEINKYLESILEMLSVPGRVNIMGISPDEASRKAIDEKKAAAQTQATAASPEAVAQNLIASVEKAMATAQAQPQPQMAAATQAATQPQPQMAATTQAAAQSQEQAPAMTATAPLAATIKYRSAQTSAKRPRFCSNCGNPLSATGSFCINCGTRVGGMI